MRTPNPLTAINRIRRELDRLEVQVTRQREKRQTVARAARPSRRGAARQACSVCGRTGHNSRFHKKRAGRRG